MKHELECIGNRVDHLEDRISDLNDRHAELTGGRGERTQISKK